MNFNLAFYDKSDEKQVLDINTLVGKSVEEITNIVKKSIIIDDYQWIIKIVLSWLPDDWIFLWQAINTSKNMQMLVSMSVDAIIKNIDYNNHGNKLKN